MHQQRVPGWSSNITSCLAYPMCLSIWLTVWSLRATETKHNPLVQGTVYHTSNFGNGWQQRVTTCKSSFFVINGAYFHMWKLFFLRKQKTLISIAVLHLRKYHYNCLITGLSNMKNCWSLGKPILGTGSVCSLNYQKLLLFSVSLRNGLAIFAKKIQ